MYTCQNSREVQLEARQLYTLSQLSKSSDDIEVRSNSPGLEAIVKIYIVNFSKYIL